MDIIQFARRASGVNGLNALALRKQFLEPDLGAVFAMKCLVKILIWRRMNRAPKPVQKLQKSQHQ